MHRAMIGFHEDEAGDWVAELDCLHNQHVRHRPPFQDRAWAISEAGRTERLGQELDCPLCDRAELPEGLTLARRAGPFDQDSLPDGLRRDHRVAPGRWGLLRILAGRAAFSMKTSPPIERVLGAGDEQPIPPGVPHQVRPSGPVSLEVDFLARP